jgi:hypothetical protein
MAKIGGRQVEVGIGIETTPGTPVAAANYFKWDSFSMQAESVKTILTSSRGIRNKNSNSQIVKQYGKGSIEFVPTVDMLPYILGLTLGSRSSAAASGESTGAYDHTFTIQNANASMKTATLLVAQGSVATERYSNCVVDSFDLTIEKDLAKCKVGILSAFPDTGTISSSYTQDTMFTRNQMFAQFGTTLANAAGTAAFTTLTSTGTNPADGDTILIGTFNGPTIVYTFKTALTGAAYEIFIGASASVTLDNIKSAINDTGTEGTNYGFNTTAHPSVVATTKTATTLLITANQSGTAGNSITTTKTGTQLSFTAGTLASGAGTAPTPLVGFTFSLSNAVLLEDAFLSGSAQPVAGGFIAGPLTIKGSYTLQFSDTVELAKYKSNTAYAMIMTLKGAQIGLVSQEKIQLKLGRLVLTKPPVEYQIDGIVLLKQEFEVLYDGTDKEVTAVVTNTYVGTNYQ